MSEPASPVLFAGGSSTAIVGPDVLVLVDAAPDLPLVARLTGLVVKPAAGGPVVGGGATLSEVLDELATFARQAPISFVALAGDGAELRVVRAGDAQAEVVLHSGERQHATTDALPDWQELVVGGAAAAVAWTSGGRLDDARTFEAAAAAAAAVVPASSAERRFASVADALSDTGDAAFMIFDSRPSAGTARHGTDEQPGAGPEPSPEPLAGPAPRRLIDAVPLASGLIAPGIFVEASPVEMLAGVETSGREALAGDSPRFVDFRSDSARQSGGHVRPNVRAVRCPSGHANPPTGSTCRACGARISDRHVVSVERPSLGRLRFSTGTVVELTAPVLLGRKPTAEHVRGEPPILVTLPDPERMLSRNHAEVRVDEWHVEVVDLGSLNHTYVELPGRPVERLRAGEPCPIVPGSQVNLGGAAFFVYEVH